MKTSLMWAMLILVPSLLLAADYQTAFLPNGTEYFADRFVLTTLTGVPPLALDQALSGNAITGVKSIDYLCAQFNVTSIEPFYSGPVRSIGLRDLIPRMYIFHVASGSNVIEACAAFRTSSDIECADLYDIPHATYFPNDPQRTSQWHLGKVQAYQAWDLFRGDTTSYGIVGVVDTGVYWTHPDLAPNMWVNVAEDLNGNGTMDNGDYNGQDDDGNGYVDDVIGWDLGMNDNNPAENSPTHGTHVAGDASEATDNNLNGAGVGFSVRIMAVKGTNSQNQLTAVYPGMVWASENGAHVINCSWGSAQYSQSNQNLINGIWANGVVVVAAAGNDNSSSRFYPAGYNNVVAVAATNSTDHKSSFSNYGTWIDVSAPGENIFATWAQSSMAYLDGTSMASPITSGIVAIIKAAHPDWTNTDLVNTLTTSADNIDGLNPSYAGQLGSGRVNAFNALGSGSFPHLSVFGQEITMTSDDGDSVLNPGESFNLVLTVENLWADAESVTVNISGSSFTFTDSSVFFGNIAHAQRVSNSLEPFRLTALQDMPLGDQNLFVLITADTSYSAMDTVQIRVSLDQRHFPLDIPGNIDSSPIIYDFDLDGSNEILFGCMDRNIYAIEADGSNSPGWPKSIANDIFTGPAIGDLDHDGTNEVVAITKDGKFYAWHSDGTPVANFPVIKGGLFYSGPLLVDLDGNSTLEIVAGSFTDNKVYVIDNTGADYAGWPSPAINKWYGAPTAADIDGDQLDEIVYAGFDSSVHVWNGDGTEVTGFPVHLNAQVWTAVSAGDVDGNAGLEIAAVTYTGNCYLINSSGVIMSGFPVHYNTSFRSTPSLVDINSDGHLEIIFGATDGNLHALDMNGAEMSGFPKSVSGAIFGTPVVGDISGDGQPDILVGTLGGNVYGFDRTGANLQYFPIMGESTRPISASLALGDLDRDGDMEIVVPIKELGQNLQVIDYKASALFENLKWPNFGRDAHRTNNSQGVLTSTNEAPAVPTAFGLSQNYPNPFNAGTTIRFSLKSDGQASLSIYDLLGRKIRSLNSGLMPAGEHAFIWNGTDQSNAAVTSGVYFYRLESADGTITKRMVLLK